MTMRQGHCGAKRDHASHAWGHAGARRACAGHKVSASMHVFGREMQAVANDSFKHRGGK